METWSAHQLFNKATDKLDNAASKKLRSYALALKNRKLPVIFTLRHLSHITDVDYSLLRKTVMRRREMANYRMFPVRKHSGGWRYIHQVSRDLFKVQQFINSEILQKLSPHPSSFAFHSNGGIKACASQHCNARWLFQYDLKDFFYFINEKNIYTLFKDSGYRSLLAFELARLCTTTHLPNHLLHYIKQDSHFFNNYNFYNDIKSRIGVLPQGAPTSPMLSNLVAYKLDELLTKLSEEYGLVYTRYADDITFSSIDDYSVQHSRFRLHREIVKIIRQNGFCENTKKTRISGPGARKLVLGLLVDGCEPRLSKEMYKRIERLLYASNKYGIIEVAKNEKFDTPYGLYNHLAGLVSFVNDVDKNRWQEFNDLFSKINNPFDLKTI
ncbi:RNA-directed DNA polymerase [Pasteurella canis]|uniref:reverse transcriptase family protein n=1 Tax=Pasteurella canis TaxID=753 RepID=UPI001E391DE2|nr:reverse transcriptase family protein [Pasteurella canis]GJJ80763.1 RNA-directed DNA polymerase [Pasteurella canis]